MSEAGIKRVYIDARNITQVPNGVGNYGKFLIPELLERSPSWQFVLIRHSSNQDALFPGHDNLFEAFTDDKIGSPKDWILGAGQLHKVFRKFGPPDLFHNLFHVSPLGLSTFGALRPKEIVTLHDLIWIDHARISQPTLGKAAFMHAYAKASIPHTLRRADHVICVSDATKHRAEAWVPSQKLTTIHHGVDTRYFESYPAPSPQGPLANVMSLGHPYIVAVGNDKPYKNLPLLLHAFARVLPKLGGKAHLVLVGSCARLTGLITKLGLEDHVTLPGFMDQEDLCQTLAHARMFVFPSKVEGFGLPPLEAMALGTPTVVADLEPMRTVAGGAALRVDAERPHELVGAIERVMTRDDVHADLRQRGLLRAQQMTWGRSAKKTLGVYQEVLSQ